MAKASDIRDKSLDELEKEITCAVCQGHYQHAKLLPCNHYYCGVCIEEIAKHARGKPFDCPECRKETRLPPGGVAELQDAFFVERMKDLYDRMAKALAEEKIDTVSPHLKRRPIGQHQAPPPALPEHPSTERPPPSQDPPWKRQPAEEKDPLKPSWLKHAVFLLPTLPCSDRKGSGSGSCDTPIHASSSSEHLPPPVPPKPKVFQRPPLPLAPAEQQPELPPRPPRLPEQPLQRSDMPPKIPQLTFPSQSFSDTLPPRPPKSQEMDRALPLPPFQSSVSPVGQSWYHANIKDRKVAEARLMRYSTKDGTFMVRDSSIIHGEYSLSVLYNGAVKHLRIQLQDGQCVLGNEPFPTVLDLVNHYKKHPLVLRSGGKLKLLYGCPS